MYTWIQEFLRKISPHVKPPTCTDFHLFFPLYSFLQLPHYISIISPSSSVCHPIVIPRLSNLTISNTTLAPPPAHHALFRIGSFQNPGCIPTSTLAVPGNGSRSTTTATTLTRSQAATGSESEARNHSFISPSTPLRHHIAARYTTQICSTPPRHRISTISHLHLHPITISPPLSLRPQHAFSLHRF